MELSCSYRSSQRCLRASCECRSICAVSANTAKMRRETLTTSLNSVTLQNRKAALPLSCLAVSFCVKLPLKKQRLYTVCSCKALLFLPLERGYPRCRGLLQLLKFGFQFFRNGGNGKMSYTQDHRSSIEMNSSGRKIRQNPPSRKYFWKISKIFPKTLPKAHLPFGIEAKGEESRPLGA